MNSILNSISAGDLQVLNVPRVKPVKEDSIINMLQNSEIEFKIEPKQTPKLNNFDSQFSTTINNHSTTNQDLTNNSIIGLLQNNYEIDCNAFNNCCACQDKSEIVTEAHHDLLKDCNCKDKQEEVSIQDLQNLAQNSEIEFNRCQDNNNLSNFNTGFGGNNDLHYETECVDPDTNNFNTGFEVNNEIHPKTECKIHNIKTPLYQENYFSEFKTEEERQAARHALGLYTNTDVVLMTLLTAENGIPSQDVWQDAEIKQMQNGYEFFTPLTSFNAVYDSNGKTLDSRVKELQSLIQSSQKEINKINQASSGSTITSLQDVKLFLEGFSNGETLRETINNMDQQMIRFEKTGQI